MTYKVYMTIELPGTFDSKEAAMNGAVRHLQDAVTVFDPPSRAKEWLNIMRGSAIQARVFVDGEITSGADHEFIVDICDGAI